MAKIGAADAKFGAIAAGDGLAVGIGRAIGKIEGVASPVGKVVIGVAQAGSS